MIAADDVLPNLGCRNECVSGKQLCCLLRSFFGVVGERGIATACGVACALCKDVLWCLLGAHAQNVRQETRQSCLPQSAVEELNCMLSAVVRHYVWVTIEVNLWVHLCCNVVPAV
jgi:hypothetical protein